MADPNLQPVLFSGGAKALAAGCNDQQMVADYENAMVFENRVKGFAVGLAVGAVAFVAFAIFLKMKDDDARKGGE